MYMKKYPCVYMRGGTSKAVFFHEKDLPEEDVYKRQGWSGSRRGRPRP